MLLLLLQEVTWTELDGRTYSRRYRPPDAASHLTISMWSDTNQTRAFGGQLDASQRGTMHVSLFRGLRRILCDEPLPSTPGALGPAWLYAPSAAELAAAPPPGLAELAGGGGGRTLVTSVAGRPGYCMASMHNPDERAASTSTTAAALLSVYACSSASPLWSYDEATQALRMAGLGCLAGEDGQPVIAACSEGAPAQQWSLHNGSRLRSKSGLCIGVGGSAVKPQLTGVPCGSAKELSWKPGGARGRMLHACSIAYQACNNAMLLLLLPTVSNLLLHLKPAKPLVTANPVIGYCLRPDVGEVAKPSELQPGLVSVAPCQASNHAFYYQPASQQLIRKDTKLCLTANTSTVSLQPCLASAFAAAANQQWQLAAGGQLRTASDACIGLQQSGAVVVVKCGTDAEARWAFGGACARVAMRACSMHACLRAPFHSRSARTAVRRWQPLAGHESFQGAHNGDQHSGRPAAGSHGRGAGGGAERHDTALPRADTGS